MSKRQPNDRSEFKETAKKTHYDEYDCYCFRMLQAGLKPLHYLPWLDNGMPTALPTAEPPRPAIPQSTLDRLARDVEKEKAYEEKMDNEARAFASGCHYDRPQDKAPAPDYVFGKYGLSESGVQWLRGYIQAVSLFCSDEQRGDAIGAIQFEFDKLLGLTK